MSYKREHIEEFNTSEAGPFTNKLLKNYRVVEFKDIKTEPGLFDYRGESIYILETLNERGHMLEYVTVSHIEFEGTVPTLIIVRNRSALYKTGSGDGYIFKTDKQIQTLKGPELYTDYTFYEKNDSKKAGGKRRNRTRRTRRRTQNRKNRNTRRSRRSA